MFERFTGRARRVVASAQEEARLLNHNYIGTEHLLLGLVRDGDGVAARALAELGISLEALRREVEEIIGRGQNAPAGHIPFTPRAKKVLELSLREALQLGHDYIGTEHILLGLVREGEGVAAQVLIKLGAPLPRVRETVLALTAGHAGPERPAGEPAAVQAPLWSWAASSVEPALVEPPELRRVIPIAKGFELPAGRRLTVVSVELWSVGGELRYTLAAPGADLERPEASVAEGWRLGDDAGTDYQVVGHRTAGSRAAWSGAIRFVPSPVPDATVLTVALETPAGGEPLRIEVPLDGGVAFRGTGTA